MTTPIDPPTSDESSTGPTSRRQFLAAAAGVGVIAGTGAVSAGGLQSSPTASVTFTDQPTDGQSVIVGAMTLPNSGFVAIHDRRLLDGAVLDSVIGVSEKLGPGSHTNVPVQLFKVPGSESTHQRLDQDQLLIAMLHGDTNSNGTYDFLTSGGTKDGPYKKKGTPVADKAQITVTEKPNRLQTTVTFDNQSTDGKNVTIQLVTMTDGGYVAVHDNSLLNGNVIGSVIGVTGALAAGTHENVEVTLFEGVPGAEYTHSQLTADQTLIAMAHRDTNDNETYDFVRSDGNKDDPYTRDNEPITDSATLTVTVESPMASVSFTEQTSDGTSVRVDSTTLSSGGFVAIHDRSLLDGNVIGSVIGVSEKLGSGPHENVPVTLFDVPGREDDHQQLKAEQKLIAMAHLDTESNGTYDFVTSGGTKDGPYTIDGQPVVDTGCIHLQEQSH